MDSTARVEKAFNNYIDRLNIAKVGITYTIVSDVNHADVIVFHDQRSSEILSKHKFTIDDLMSGQEFQVNHEVAKTITQVVRNDTAGCLGFDTTLESFERLKSIVFVSSAGDDQRVSQCLSSLLLASLGLTSKDTPGETVESLQSPFLVPTENDLIALKLLYGKSIGPGDTIEQVLASQDLVKFLPH